MRSGRLDRRAEQESLVVRHRAELRVVGLVHGLECATSRVQRRALHGHTELAMSRIEALGQAGLKLGNSFVTSCSFHVGAI